MNQETTYERSREVAREYCVVLSYDEPVSGNNVVFPADGEGNKWGETRQLKLMVFRRYVT